MRLWLVLLLGYFVTVKKEDIEMVKPVPIILITVFLFYFTGASGNSENNTALDLNCPFSFGASYIGDFYNNFSGGISTGTGFMGMANLNLCFDTEKANWWKGGNLFVNGATTHGKSPSENYTGDFQIVSNIDAGNLIYLYELWYKQSFPNVEITIGLQDMNQLFAATDNGSFFLNSSFGIPPVISNNVLVPIFPLTGIGISATYNITDNLNALAGIFDGSPTDFAKNPYNINWDWDKDDGAFMISEFQYETTNLSLNGTYKIGGYFHTGSLESDEMGLKSQLVGRNYGFYAIADQDIWKGTGNRGISLFSQLAWSPGHTNTQNFYAGAGCNFYNPLKLKRENITGIAVAAAAFHHGVHKHETTIETFFNYQLNKYISIQPDIQYIINPAGTSLKLKNACIAFIRFGIEF